VHLRSLLIRAMLLSSFCCISRCSGCLERWKGAGGDRRDRVESWEGVGEISSTKTMPGKRLIFYDLNNDEDSRQPQLELQVPQLMMRIEIMVIMTRAGMWGRVGRPSSTCFGRNREEKLAEEASHPDIGDDKRSPARRLFVVFWPGHNIYLIFCSCLVHTYS